jgi:homospermidine synthase
MPKRDITGRRILLLGIGGVGKCIAYYLQTFFEFDNKDFFIVDKDDKQAEFVTIKELISKGVNFIHKEIGKDYKKFFGDLLSKDDIVIDCTARSPCIKWLKFLTKCEIFYINTSIESDVMTNNKGPYLNSISHQHKQIDKLKTGLKGRFLIEYGTNPGLITSFCYKALDDMAKYMNIYNVNNYAKLAYTLGIQEIHCSEIDTQLGGNINRHIFNNTWSAVGLLDELSEGSEIYLGNTPDKQIERLKPKSVLAKYIDDNNILLTKTNSVNNKAKSICYTANIKSNTLKTKKAVKLSNGNKDFSEITGYLIHHGEILDIGTMLKYKDFVPTVYYVYDINTEADKNIQNRGLKQIHKESYDSTKVNVMNVYNNKIEGTDNIGIYIKCKNNLQWWCGSVLETKYTINKLKDKYYGPTVIQVMCGVLGGLCWLLDQPKGIYFGRHVDHNFILNKMEKYLNVKSMMIDGPTRYK